MFSPKSCTQSEFTVFHLGGALVPVEELRVVLFCIFLEGEPGPCLSQHHCFLSAPALFLQSLPSLISNCLNLPFGTQGRSRRLKEAYFLQARNKGHGKDLYGRTP